MIDLWMDGNREGNASSQARAVGLQIPLVVFGLFILSSCGGSSGDGGGDDNASDDPTYSIAGYANSIDHGDLTLQLNGDEELIISESGPFVFSTELDEGESYHVRISEQPSGWVCRIDSNSGQIQGSNINNVSIDCEAQFEVVSDIMQLALRWVGPSSVNIVYSTDHDCDWGNYSLCDDAGIIPDASDGSLTLRAVDDGLDPRKGWFFVLDEGGSMRGPVGARPAPAIPDNIVRAMVSDDHRLYIGGSFSRIGMHVGGGAAFDSQSGQPQGALPAVEGFVYAVEPDGEGGWYIGGSFNNVGGYARNNLARIRKNGSVDEEWVSGVDGRVYDLVIEDGQVFVAGKFSYADEVYQPNLAAFDAITGALNAEWRPSVNDAVRAMGFHDGSLFVGGEFTEVDGLAASYIAAVDSGSGSRLEGWEADADGLVFDIEASETHLYIAGSFSQVNSVDRFQIAALAIGTGQLDDGWDVVVEGRGQGYIGDQMMRSIYLHGDTLYVAGDFDHVNDEIRFRLAAVDAGSGTLSDWNPSEVDRIRGSVMSVVRSNDTVYIGGSFNRASGPSRRNLAAFDASSAELIDWNPQTSESVSAVAVQPGSVYAGGRIVGIQGVRRAGLAAIDLRNGTVVDEWTPTVDRPVMALDMVDNTLFVGGIFSEVNGQEIPHLAALYADSGEISSEFRPDIDDSVFSVTIDDDLVYVGGLFRNVNSQSQAGIASISRHDGTLESGWNGQVDGLVRSLLVKDGVLYAGGTFASYESVDHENLIALDIDGGGLIENWNPKVDDEVLALAANDDRLFIGGGFRQVGEHSREHIAALHRDSGSLDQHWSGTVNGAVQSLQLRDGRLYVGGLHWRASNQPIVAMVAFDSADGGWVSEWNPGAHAVNQVVDLKIYSMHIAGGSVFAGGHGSIGSLGAYDKTDGHNLW